ncbi:maleylpyruvate isomerase N-terminal domain-containing protein [Nocardioides panacis]|uniref:maleylpyruvate isomerase N-terminal domain-containing protein n=1 Tax=Nocardioides panacis TaxID=2849501 RepID=UPI00345F00C8
MAWSDLRAPVPGCPGWSVLDLVVHVGNVHAWAATIVETGRAAAEQNDRPSSSRPPRGEQLVRRQGRGPLRGAARRGPGRPVLELRVRQRHEAVLAAAPAARDDRPPGRPGPDAAPGDRDRAGRRTRRRRRGARGVPAPHAPARPARRARPSAGGHRDRHRGQLGGRAAPPAGRDAAGARPGCGDDERGGAVAPADGRAPALLPPAGRRGPGRGHRRGALPAAVGPRRRGHGRRPAGRRRAAGAPLPRLPPGALTGPDGQRPWLATAAMASAAAAGSRYSPPRTVGRRCSSSR